MVIFLRKILHDVSFSFIKNIFMERDQQVIDIDASVIDESVADEPIQNDQTNTRRAVYGKVKNKPWLVEQLRLQNRLNEKRFEKEGIQKKDINTSQVVDLVQTRLALQKANDIIKEVITEMKGSILFIGTEEPVSSFLTETSQRFPIHYISTKWISGMLTNWRMLSKAIRRFHTLDFLSKNGYFDEISSQDIVKLQKQKARLEKYIGGIKHLQGLPHLVILFSPKELVNVTTECKKFGIPVIGIFDPKYDRTGLSLYVPYTNNIDGPLLLSWILAELLETIQSAMKSIGPPIQTVEPPIIPDTDPELEIAPKTRRRRNPRRKFFSTKAMISGSET